MLNRHRQDQLNAGFRNRFQIHLEELDLHRVFVTHNGYNADADYLAAAIRELAPVEDLCITTAGCTVSSHCGPDTIGILYLTK